MFLDEIGDLPLSLQVKLLRVIQEREVVRIGSRKAIPVNTRLLAGTNVDLDDAVQAGNFRRDLLYRINIAQVTLPPLRDRPGDILPLVDHFLKVYSKRMQQELPTLLDESARLLINYQWPGNIRELENVIHFALLVSGEREIRPEHLKVTGGWDNKGLAGNRANLAEARNAGGSNEALFTSALHKLFAGPAGAHYDNLEKLIITEAFHFSDDNQVRTASLLGISRNVVRTLLKRHGFLGNEESDAA